MLFSSVFYYLVLSGGGNHKGNAINLSLAFIPTVNNGVRWFLLLGMWSKTCGVTIHMNPLQQFLNKLLFVFQHLEK